MFDGNRVRGQQWHLETEKFALLVDDEGAGRTYFWWELVDESRLEKEFELFLLLVVWMMVEFNGRCAYFEHHSFST